MEREEIVKFELRHYASFIVVASLFGPTSSSFGQEPVKVIPPQQKSLDGGQRFVFGQISEYRRDQFMLDTLTGRLWRVVNQKTNSSGSEEGITVLEPVPYGDIEDGHKVYPYGNPKK